MHLQAANIQIAKIEESLKEKYKESCEEMIHERIDDEFRRICKLILTPSRKLWRTKLRRNSLTDFKTETNLSEKIEGYIEKYLS